MHVVFGKPIELPKLGNTTDEEVQKYLDAYIHAMEQLCQKHKHEAGYGKTVFRVV